MAHRPKLRTLGAHSYNWYSMKPPDLMIMKIPILRELDWYLVRYLGVKLLPGWLDAGRFWPLKPSKKATI